MGVGLLLEDLVSARFAVRQKASAKLETMGEAARPALEKPWPGSRRWRFGSVWSAFC
jgi:hypothetical protein